MAIMALARPAVETYIYVDPMVYPSLMVGNQKIERIGPGRCECGRVLDVFVERREGPYRSTSQMSLDCIGGRQVVWRSFPKCPACKATDALIAFKPMLRTRTLDRGIHRSALLEAVQWCLEKRTRMGDLEAALIEEILGASTAEWIPTVSFTQHAYAAQLGPIVTNLQGSNGPPDAAFPLGRVLVEVPRGFTLHDQTVLPLLARHERADGGQNGRPAESISPAANWCPSFATISEQNRASIDARDGAVRSLYEIPEMINGHRFSVELCTWLEGQQPATTYVIAAIG
jgi:hypothetical protein